MKRYLIDFPRTFAASEDGAVTVDWVVLSALVVTLLGAGYGALETGTNDLSTDTATYMTNWTF
ncbi:hypothetical protein N4R57_05330 [Rhodobacteraceae bacterium D3-12]|nr:hypothetical protein N4R57_05330 [Rhodobacteraceae bacterium D3-12]